MRFDRRAGLLLAGIAKPRSMSRAMPAFDPEFTDAVSVLLYP